MYIMNLDSLKDNENLYYLPDGRLSDAGKKQFWKELDYQMKKFDRRQINLKPELKAIQMIKPQKSDPKQSKKPVR